MLMFPFATHQPGFSGRRGCTVLTNPNHLTHTPQGCRNRAADILIYTLGSPDNSRKQILCVSVLIQSVRICRHAQPPGRQRSDGLTEHSGSCQNGFASQMLRWVWGLVLHCGCCCLAPLKEAKNPDLNVRCRWEEGTQADAKQS